MLYGKQAQSPAFSPRVLDLLLRICLLLGCHIDNNWRNTPICFLKTLSVLMGIHQPPQVPTLIPAPRETLPVILSWLYPNVVRVHPRASKSKQLRPVFIHMLRVGQISKSMWLQKHRLAWSGTGEKANRHRVP